MTRAFALVAVLAGCGGAYCDALPTQDFSVRYQKTVVVEGIHANGHTNVKSRLIRISETETAFTLAHEIHHLALADAGVPAADHHAIMARCGT